MSYETKVPKLLHPDRLYIDGQWVSPASPSMIEVISPTTDTAIASVAEAREADIELAVKAARHAFDRGPWPRMAPSERAAVLRRMGAILRSKIPELANCWIEQIGTLAGVAPFVVTGGVNWFDFYADLAATYPWTEERPLCDQPGTGLVLRDPVGVVAAIAPWNNPFGIMAGKIAPALLAGCTVVMKPAPETPLEAYIIAQAAQEAGVPPGVLNLVTAYREASDHLVRHPSVDKVSFTGSVAAGMHIASVCGARLARCTTELGGKSAAIILNDYDIESAARMLARTISMSAGQICAMLSRALVPAHRLGAFIAAAVAEMEAIRVGPPRDPASEMGPLAMARQRDRVETFIAQAVREGAVIATGGRRPPHLDRGAYFEPTLLTGVTPDMTVAREEVFGPVLSVIGYDSIEQAIALANDTAYGLYGTVFTHDREAAMQIIRAVRSGTMTQNAFCFDSALPFGGFKHSGCGREGGKEGLDGYIEYKSVILAS